MDQNNTSVFIFLHSTETNWIAALALQQRQQKTKQDTSFVESPRPEL